MACDVMENESEAKKRIPDLILICPGMVTGHPLYSEDTQSNYFYLEPFTCPDNNGPSFVSKAYRKALITAKTKAYVAMQ